MQFYLFQYNLPSDNQYRILGGERIGFTYPFRQYGIITFEYTEAHLTYFSEVSPDDLPEVGGQAVKFDSIHLPSIFSIAVDIGPGKCMLSTTITIIKIDCK